MKVWADHTCGMMGRSPDYMNRAMTGFAAGAPFLGDPDARLQVLLPDETGFDLAMNIFTYQPGATLPSLGGRVCEEFSPDDDVEIQALVRNASTGFQRVVQMSSNLPDELQAIAKADFAHDDIYGLGHGLASFGCH